MPNRPISSADMVERACGLIEAEIDNDVVVLNDRGTCYGLNEVGSRVWHMLANPVRTRDICKALVAEYQIEADICERQVLDLLEELRNTGLITMREDETD
jgi:hypothetical protein